MNNLDACDRRCLILGCTKRKRDSTDPIPAIERYDGPSFRVLRRFLRDAPDATRNLDILVLSAKYGLIDGYEEIGNYDQIMTPSRAKELKNNVESQIANLFGSQNYQSVFLSMGKPYQELLGNINKVLGSKTQVVTSASGSGRKLTELKNWLWEYDQASIVPKEEEITVQTSLFPQLVVLRGKQVELTTDQAKRILNEAIHNDHESAREIRIWYADIDGEKISPKWAAKQLFGLAVRDFTAEEARRALRQLGIGCQRYA